MPGLAGSNDTHFPVGRGISVDGRAFATSEGMLHRIHGHTMHMWPGIPPCLIIVVGWPAFRTGLSARPPPATTPTTAMLAEEMTFLEPRDSFTGVSCSIWKFPGLGVQSELAASLHCSLWQCWILNPLSDKARDQTHILMDTSWILNLLSRNGNSALRPSLSWGCRRGWWPSSQSLWPAFPSHQASPDTTPWCLRHGAH